VIFARKMIAKFLLLMVSMGRFMSLGSRVAVIDGKRVLLVHHTYVKGWQLPGGGVEHGQTFEGTMRNELLEEAGFRAGENVELHGIFLNNYISKRDHVALYVVRDFTKEREFEANREIAEIGWFEHDQLPDNMAHGARERIEEIFQGREKSLYW